MTPGGSMLLWMALGLVVVVYALIFLLTAIRPQKAASPHQDQPRPFWTWLSRRSQRTCFLLSAIGLVLSSTCFSAAASSYGRLSTEVQSRRRVSYSEPTSLMKSLRDDLTVEHRQAVQAGTLHEWQKQFGMLTDKDMPLVLDVLRNIEDTVLASDALYGIQQGTGQGLGIRRGQQLNREHIADAITELQSAAAVNRHKNSDAAKR